MLLTLLLSGALAAEPIVAGEDPVAVPGVALGTGAWLTFDGFLDVGWFDAADRGVAYRQVMDPTDRELHGAAWFFVGDPWANAVNSLGESADLGIDDTTTLARADLDSDGNPTFLVNQWQQGLTAILSEQLTVRGAFNLAPRQGELGRLGDQVWVDQAFIQWRPRPDADLRFTLGKAESVFGTQYRSRLAPDRYGITPALMSRYTSGTPTGVTARGTLRQRVELAAALTNGSPVTERFGHFFDELDRNGVPTATGRVGLLARGSGIRLSSGVSALVGAQDGQPDPRHLGSQLGWDLNLEFWVVEWLVEVVRVRNPGDPTQERLLADGWSVEGSAAVNRWLRPLVRVDRRSALMHVVENAYDSDVLRFTGGFRVDVDYHLAIKAEYLHLRELDSTSLAEGQISNDVLTTSAVVHF